MTPRTLLVLGAGGHGKAVAEAALLSGQWQRIAFVDDRWPQLGTCFGWPVLATVAGLPTVAGQVDAAIAAAGNNVVRAQWLQAIRAIGLPVATVIHPSACVSPSAQLGDGVAIMALAMVGVEARVEEGALINANATVDHDAYLGPFAHLGVGVQLAGGVRIEAHAWLQVGCCVGFGVVVASGVHVSPGTALSA